MYYYEFLHVRISYCNALFVFSVAQCHFREENVDIHHVFVVVSNTCHEFVSGSTEKSIIESALPTVYSRILDLKTHYPLLIA